MQLLSAMADADGLRQRAGVAQVGMAGVEVVLRSGYIIENDQHQL